MKTRILPEQDKRVETGPTQFGDDWPGTFIRGDDSFFYALALAKVINENNDPYIKPQLQGLLELLRSCQIK